MCGFQDVLSNVMPIDWLDPYGRTPFAKDAELSVDITIVETDDGIRARSVKNPPTTSGDRLMDAIRNALGMASDICDPVCKPQQADDQALCNTKGYDEKPGKSDTMKPSSSEDSERQGSQPWSSEKSPEEPDGTPKEKDAKEKAPRFK